MAKSDEQRIEETLRYIFDLFPDQGARICNVLRQWVKKQNQALLSHRISLGEWQPFSGAAEKQIRHARRALLLVYEYGQVPPAGRLHVSTMSPRAVHEKIIAFFTPSAPGSHRGNVSLAPSFDYATEAERAWALDAGAEVLPRLNAVLAALSIIEIDRRERARFEKWFGRFSVANHQSVLQNVRKLQSSPKGLRLYYRGDRVPRDAVENFPPHQNPVHIYREPQRAAYWARDKERDADPHYWHIFLCIEFWGAMVQRRGLEGISTSRCAVLIHELTHCVCQTNDKLGMTAGYGSENCRTHADNNHAEVLTNASNYQWYVDEFCDTGRA